MKSSPAECTGILKRAIDGRPDMKQASMSHVERNNLSMRIGMLRFTRLVDAFSKTLENHLHMLSLYVVHQNSVRIHGSLQVTPAMAAGIPDTPHDMKWTVGLMDARVPNSNRPATYKRPEISNRETAQSRTPSR